MKKIFVLSALLCICFFAIAQKVTVAKPTMITKIIPSQKATVVRKDVVKIKTQLVQLQDSITSTKKDIDDVVDKMKNDLDSINEMGETESLRLQMAMDRLSKMMTTLSNMLKKINDTAQSITQNMK